MSRLASNSSTSEGGPYDWQNCLERFICWVFQVTWRRKCQSPTSPGESPWEIHQARYPLTGDKTIWSPLPATTLPGDKEMKSWRPERKSLIIPLQFDCVEKYHKVFVLIFFAWARYLAFAPFVPSWAIAIVRLPSQLDFASVSLLKVNTVFLHKNMINFFMQCTKYCPYSPCLLLLITGVFF